MLERDDTDNKKKDLTTTQVIILGFLTVIILGSILLWLPISAADGKPTAPIDAVFTATTSVCVTGLVTVDTYSHWSTFGHVVILILIQLGGLGIVSFTTGLMVMVGRKVTLKDRLLLQDAFNLGTLSGLVRFLKSIVKGTFLIEIIGAIGYMTVFIPKYGPRGIWISIFTSISAFCNAGIDIMGPNSLMDYSGNYMINIVTMLLVILGGLGFVVWWDVLRVIKLRFQREIETKEIFQKMYLHSKLVFVSTGILLVAGAILVYAFEHNNPDTLGHMPEHQKILASIFQSVTLRTAGFLTISQKGLRDATAFISLIFMMIGGSPVGTAGGIKTTTVMTLLLSVRAAIKGEEEVSVFRRTIPDKVVRKSLAVVGISVMAMILMVTLMNLVCDADFVDLAYETVSALGTVGLSRNLTSSLPFIGKLLIVICMYLGRIGPISMVLALTFRQDSKKKLIFPKEDITVG